jgi:pterin-4a-carbinolamine dehydratase
VAERRNTRYRIAASRRISDGVPRRRSASEYAVDLGCHSFSCTRIERSFRFRNFREALTFVQEIGELAEAKGHHPNINFGWGNATVSLPVMFLSSS